MTWEYSPLAAVLIGAGASAVAVAGAMWRRREVPGARALILLMLAVAVWTVFRGFEAAAVGVPAKVFWSKLEYFGIVSVAPLWLLFALAYARQAAAPPPPSLGWLWAVPAITVALVLTSEHHALIWTAISPSPRHRALLVYGHGAWFWVNVVYSYVLLLAGTLALIWTMMRFSDALRQRIALLLVGVAVPWCGNIVYVAGLSPIPGLDLTPIALILSGALLGWGILRLDVLDILPVARETLMENLGDGVIIVDAQGRIVDINPAAARHLGLATPAPRGLDAGQVLGAWPGLLEALLVPGDSVRELCTPGTPSRYLDVRLSPLRDHRQLVTGRLISLRDVTDRKRGEEFLRASEARFRALFEHAPDAYFLTDREARFVDANRAAERLTGYRREELLGRSFQDLHLLAPGDLERVGALLGRDAAARPSGPAEFALTRADGTRLVIEITTSLLGLADRALVLGIARDLTARRRTEDALRESEERYRNLVENVEELICTHDMDGRLLTVNRALVTTMGHERPEDLVGRSLEEFLAPDVRHHFPGYLAALRRDGA